MSIQLHQLLTFDAVIRTGSVTKAAQRLGLSQPAVSRQLQELQRSIEAKLLDRRGRGICATREGDLLAEYTRRIFALVKEAECAIHDLQHMRRGRIAIGAGTTIGVYLLPEALVRFRHRFPGISLHLEVGASHLLRDRLQDGSIDFALTETLLPSPTFDSSVFTFDKLIAIVPRGHRLAKRRSVRAIELAAEAFVVRETSSGTQSLVERALAERKIQISPVISLGSTEAVKRAVAAGLGVSIVSQMSVGSEAGAGELVALKVNDLALRRPIYLIHRHGSKQSKPEIAFLCLLKHVIRGTLPRLVQPKAGSPVPNL